MMCYYLNVQFQGQKIKILIRDIKKQILCSWKNNIKINLKRMECLGRSLGTVAMKLEVLVKTWNLLTIGATVAV